MVLFYLDLASNKSDLLVLIKNRTLMKILIFLLLLSNISIAQNGSKIEFLEKEIQVDSMMLAEFGDKVAPLLESPDQITRFGIFEAEDIYAEKKEDEAQIFRNIGGCSCIKLNDTLEIGHAVGFQAGIVIMTQINVKDSTYHSWIGYNTDGGLIHKHEKDAPFIEDIEVEFEEIQLSLSTDNGFEEYANLTGEIIGISKTYYKRDNSTVGFSERKTRILSVFQCKLMDLGAVEKRAKERMEKENSKKN